MQHCYRVSPPFSLNGKTSQKLPANDAGNRGGEVLCPRPLEISQKFVGPIRTIRNELGDTTQTRIDTVASSSQKLGSTPVACCVTP